MAGLARAQLAKNNAQLEDDSWKKYKNCGYCDRLIMVNNYDDRKSRTPKMFGLVICPWCEPRYMDDRAMWADAPKGPKPRIVNEHKYRVIVSTWLARQLSVLDDCTLGVDSDGDKTHAQYQLEKLLAQARKFWPDGNLPVQN